MSELSYAFDAAEAWREVADTDGLRAFAPHPKQERFLDSTKRCVMMLGANRTGKSKALAARIAHRLRGGSAKHIWLVTPTFAMARQNVIPILFGDPDVPSLVEKPMIPPSEVADIHLKPEWEYIGREGWKLTIKSCDSDTFPGGSPDEIDMDEPPSWKVWNECQIRFGAGRDCLIRLAATLLPSPGQAGGVCQWLYSEIIEPYLNGRAPADIEIVNVAMSDNPYITPEQLSMARSLYAPGSLDRRIRVDGELLPGLIGARCYSRFDRRLHVNKFIGRKDVDPMKPLYLAVDMNVDPLGWGILQKHNRIWRKLDEIALRPGTIDEACDLLKSRYAGTQRAALVICGDATAKRRTAQTGQTDYDLIHAALKDHFSLRFLIPERNPPERDRVNLVNFLLGGSDQEVRFEVSHECPETIADYEQVLWSKDGSGIRKAHDKTDPYYQRTAWSDGDGYVFWSQESGVIRKTIQGDKPKPSYPVPQYGFAHA